MITVKTKYKLTTFLCIIGFYLVNAQVDAGSLLGVPTVTTVEMNAIAGPALGSVVYNTTDDQLYRFNGTAWVTDGDTDSTNELSQVGAGTPAVTGATASNLGETYVDTSTGQLYVWDGSAWVQVGGNASPDADPDPTNEYNTTFSVVGTNLRITDGGGSLQVPLSSLGSDDQDLSHTVLVPNEQVRIEINDGNNTTISIEDADADPNNEIQDAAGVDFTATGNTTSTNVQDAIEEIQTELDGVDGTDDQDLGIGTNGVANQSVEVTITDGAAALIDIRDGDSSDTNEIQDAAGVDFTATGNTTSTNVQDAIEEIQTELDAVDGTDDQDLGIGTNGVANQSVEVTITDGAAALIDIRDGDSSDTNEIQNIEEVLTEGNDANGQVLTGLGAPTAASDAATKAYVDAVDGTDDQDLGIGTNGVANQSVEVTITDGAAALIDIRDGDSSDTNEIQNIEEVLTEGNDANGQVLTGLGAPTAASDAATKAYVDALDGTDDQDLGIGTNGVANQSVEVTITDGAAALIDIRDGDSSDTNEIQDAAGVDFTATGNTTSTNVQDAIEEIQTELDAVDGTDDQDLGIGTNGVANQSVEVTITDGAAALIDIRDGDSSDTNEIQNIEEVLTEGNDANGQVLTGLGAPTAASDAATKAYVDALDGTDDQDLGIGTNGVANQSVEVTITDGAAALIDIRDGDSSDTNEIQDAAGVDFTATGNTTSTNVQDAIEEIQTELMLLTVQMTRIWVSVQTGWQTRALRLPLPMVQLH